MTSETEQQIIAKKFASLRAKRKRRSVGRLKKPEQIDRGVKDRLKRPPPLMGDRAQEEAEDDGEKATRDKSEGELHRKNVGISDKTSLATSEIYSLTSVGIQNGRSALLDQLGNW